MKLDNNQQTFFELVKAGLWADSESVELGNHGILEPVGWETVYQLAEEQSVQGLVLRGIEWYKGHKSKCVSDLSQDLLLQLIGETQMVEQQNLAMNEFVAKLIEKLREEDIYALLIKGQGIAQCYERPLWRTSGDVDLLLSEDNYKKTVDCIIPLATDIEKEHKYNMHQAMTIDSWTVELHGSLRGGLSSQIDKVLDDIKNDVIRGGNVRTWINDKTQVFLPEVNGDIVYVFSHILTHFYKGGMGLRQVCDWCRLLWSYRSELDLRLLESRIRRMGLMSEWRAFGAFAVEYIGMPVGAMPLYSVDEIWKRKADRLCDFIMEVGNMGQNRDMSYFEKYPYLIRKLCSMGRRCDDLIRHARIFPIDSLRFFPRIMFNGICSAARGE